MKVLFIIRGTIKNKNKLISNIQKIFNDIPITIEETKHPTHAIEIGKKQAKKYTHVIAIGGDGTLNEVVNGIMLSESTPILGFFPSGTANDYSASMPCPPTLQELKESIQYNRTNSIYLGKGEFNDMHNFAAERYFINIADIGIGGEVVQRVNNDKSNMSANLKFFKNILITFMDFKSHDVVVEMNNNVIEEKMLSLVVAKGKYFGSRIGIAPHASPLKNELDVVKIGDISVFEYLKKIPELKKGKPIQHKDLEYFKATQLTVKTDSPSPIDMDGEFVGYTPVTFSTHDTPIIFLVS